MQFVQFLVVFLNLAVVSAYYSGYQDMLNQVNAQRSAVGLAPFCGVAKLMKSSETQSQYQATKNTMTHDGPFGAFGFNRFDAVGFGANAIAENVAYSSSPSIPAVMTMWMNSAGHKANILGNYKYFGSSRVQGSNGMYYFTQEFGSTWANTEACMSNARMLRGDEEVEEQEIVSEEKTMEAAAEVKHAKLEESKEMRRFSRE